jgi:hypothetical protein
VRPAGVCLVLAACSTGSEHRAPPRDAAPVRLPPADARVVAAPATASLEGDVLLGGTPVPSVKVSLKHVEGFDIYEVTSTVSDRAGHYRFDDLAIDPFLIINAFTNDGAPRSSRYPLQLDRPGPQRFDVPLDLAASIAGSVVDRQGAPVPYTSVQLVCQRARPDDDEACPSASPNYFTGGRDGTFTLGGLGRGNYTVLVRPAGTETGPILTAKPPVVALETASSQVADVRIVVDPTRTYEWP